MDAVADSDAQVHLWQPDIMDAFVEGAIDHVSYVPDAGHRGLINLCEARDDMGTSVLTTEEEGVALAAGLWLGGKRSALLMQSSGVGNCVNMFTLIENCRFPFVMLATMRGEWGEFVPWQIPMGKRTPDVLNIMGFDVFRADEQAQVRETVSAAIDQAYNANRAVAVLLSQRLIGTKKFIK